MDASGKMSGEELVISGISGLYPKSENIVEFMNNLYNKVDMVTTQFTEIDHPEMPKHYGLISGTDKFDTTFFRMPFKQAIVYDAMARKLLEQTYCAIFDSGINPRELKGKKIGVYLGSSYQDHINILYKYTDFDRNEFVVSGISKSMFANRISYWCDAKGPSYNIDSADASFSEALEKAYSDMKSGICEAVLVSGCSMSSLPNVCLNIKRTGTLCLDGKTKCFDKNGDGYVRSEAVGVIFLQKAKDAKRIYAEVKHVKTKYGTHPENNFLAQRKPEEIGSFLTEFYSEVNVNPSDVEYIEGQGTGLAAADVNELQAIGDVFGKQKRVMVGCVKSNMGNSEAASGVCAVTKLCLAYEKGVLPANLHCQDPLENSKVQILTDHAAFRGGYTAVNNFSATGINCHILLKGHSKSKIPDRYKSSIPYLVCVSGRQDTSIDKTVKILKSQRLDPEVIGLLHNIHKIDTPGHTSRGYAILDTVEGGQTVSLAQGSELYQGGKKPLWFVYSGMGSQWATMGAALMKIPIFATAIKKCHKILEPKGIDLIRIITHPDKKVLDNNILNCFVGITAVQIALTDVLKAININPDNIIGHSLGELGCAYCDGGLSAEDTILSSYIRGRMSIESVIIKGSMAAVGLGFKELEPLCPPEIDIACHNSFESSTISGPADIIKDFVKELASNNIFVKEVPCGNIAYHSRYIKQAAPAIQQALREVIIKPVKRSEKWISTSIPEERWGEPLAQYSSMEYHANNFMSPVYFEESARLIPQDAIIVEVAPHCLLQAIMKRSHPNCTHIPLTRRGISDPVNYLLESFGKLYLEGFNPNIENLYPKIEFPVSKGTMPLSHFTEWHHEMTWPIVQSDKTRRIMRPCREIVISVEDSDYQFITGHVRQGNIVFPEAAIIVTLWETLAMCHGKKYEDMSVSFHDVQFNVDLILKPKQALKVNFDINKGNGYFEVYTAAAVVAKGYIYESKPHGIEADDVDEIDEINSEDIYSLLNTKGYYYAKEFRSIVSTNFQMNSARVTWNKNWTTFLDSLLQLNILARNCNGVLVPKLLNRLDIDTKHNARTWRMNMEADEPYFIARVEPFCGITKCAGIEIEGLIFENKPTRSKYSQILQHASFMPYISDAPLTIEDALLLNLQIVAENIQRDIIIISDLTTETKCNIASIIDNVSDKIPFIKFDVNVMSTNNQAFTDSHLLIVPNICGQNESKLEKIILNDNFILSLNNSEEDLRRSKFQVICTRKVGSTILALLRKQVEDQDIKFIPIINGFDNTWIARVHSELTQPDKVVLVSEKKPKCGFRGLIKILRKELGNKINFIGVEDHISPKFKRDNFYRNQLKNNLFVNILKDGQWGGFYQLPCSKACSMPENFSLVSDLGLLNNLNWAETPIERKNNNLVQVHYAGISKTDVEKATGLLKTNYEGFGMDFSGIDEKGQNVMGLVPSGALASAVEADPHFIWPVPNHWNLEEAATVPLPYIQAYYCLFIKKQLRRRNISKIFITNGAEAFGQAVISICLSMKWIVYTSVGDINQKHYLMKRFPELNENHISSLEENDFLTMITTQTKGEKYVLIINTYDGEMREYAMKCTGLLGIFMDVCDYGIRENEPINMGFLNEDRTYTAVNLSAIFHPEFTNDRKLLQQLLIDGIEKEVVRPITHVVFNKNEVTRAFRLLSKDKRCSRFLIKIRDGSATAKHFEYIPRISCAPNALFVIVCDNSNLGIELGNRLVMRGARNLVMHLEQENNMMRYLNTKLAMWRKFGVNVDIRSEDLQVHANYIKLLTYRNNDKKVHGIFFIKPLAKGNSTEGDIVNYGNEITTIASDLDSVSRNNCPELKYFVIITRTSNNVDDEYSTSVLENITHTRAESGLPALLFCTDIQDEFQVGAGTHLIGLQTIDTTLDSLESSLRQNFVNIMTHNISKNKPSTFLNSVSQILGVDINNIEENLTVGDFISSIAVFEELRILLNDVTSLEHTTDAVKNLTISRLKTLNVKNTKFESGLSVFYNHMDKVEIDTTNILIPMPTILNKLVENEYGIESNETYLVLIPGFEGHPKVFAPICERLKIRAVACQLGPDMTCSNIPDIAASIKKHLRMRFRMKTCFQILGYSFGVNIALEVAALLEKEGFVGQVYCLDSSPDVLRVQMDAYIGRLSEDELQIAIIKHLFYVISGQKDDTLETELTDKNSWSEKVELCIHKLRRLVSYSADYQRAVLNSFYKRMMLARNYNPTFKLESDIVLIKGIPYPKAGTLPNDYNLSKYTMNPVKVFDMSSDFESAPEDCKVPNIINQLLGQEILERLKTANLCESYLTKVKNNKP